MKYSSPKIPVTPSSSINHQLRKRFSQPADNLLKSLISHLVCSTFHSINLLSQALIKSNYFSKTPTKHQYSHKQAWMLACLAVPFSLLVSMYFLYLLIIASSYYVEVAIIYVIGTVAVFIFCVGLCGIAFYDSDSAAVLVLETSNAEKRDD